MAKRTSKSDRITTSSTAEYFSKNLQQVGFSSQTKAVLTTLKEAVDNSLDACEENGILPSLDIRIDKLGAGSLKNSDQIRVRVKDNGPGIEIEDVPKVFGEYLASSKFGRGRCSRGQQGIGISAATTWAQLTSAKGAKIITKTKRMRKAVRGLVEVDIKSNKGVLKNKESFDWDRPHGTSVEFTFDGRIQVNGEAGLMSYLLGNVLVNPHLSLTFQLPDGEKRVIERVSETVPFVPGATDPHPHTMKLGEFIAHSHLFGRVKANQWLRKGFSRVTEVTIQELVKEAKVSKSLLQRSVDSLKDADFKDIYTGIQKLKLRAPSTQSVMAIGEEGLAHSIQRMGKIDFFSVVSRKPMICDFKPVLVECAVARLAESKPGESEESVQVLRFANRVPLQFDKSSCAIVKAITSVNWKSYGLGQPKGSLPNGAYIVAVSVVSPFIKFKNASKETIDASDELVEEIRRALMQAGQRLSRHIRKEKKEEALEEKIRHIEQFGPILVDGLTRMINAPASRKKKAEEGLMKILGRDSKEAKKELSDAESKLGAHLEKQKERLGDLGYATAESPAPVDENQEIESKKAPTSKEKGRTKKSGKKVSKKKGRRESRAQL